MSARTRPLPPYAAVDLLAVVVLTAISLAGFTDTFAGLRWVLVAAAGAAIGLAWTLVLTTLRLGLGVVLPLLPVPYLLTAGLLALGSSGLLLGVPDIETLTAVAVGTVGSWRVLVETAPLVDGEGSVLLIPYALALFPAGAASALALRSRRAALPLLPLGAGLALALVLGVTDPFSTLLQGIGFGVVALAWVAHRGLRIEAGRHGDASLGAVSARRLLVGLAVVGLVAAASYVVVDMPEDNRRHVLREAVLPYDSVYLETPLSAFRRFRDQGPGVYTNLADRKLFRVRGAGPGTRVRVAVLDRYDGTRWYADDDTSPDDFTDRFLRVSSRLDNPARGEERLYTFFVRSTWDLPWVPTIGALQGFEFYDDYASDRLPDLRYNRSTDTAILPGGLHVQEDYVLTAIPTPAKLTVRMKPWRRPDTTLQEAAGFLDVPARAWSLGAKTPMSAVFRIAERLRERGRYSDGAFGWETRFDAGQDEQRLDEGFVNAPIMVGNDEQYAATMALLANRIGVPARVAVGAVLGRNGVIKGKHLDAWVEIRVANGSWRVLPTGAFMGRRPPRRDSAPLPEVRLPPEQRPQDAAAAGARGPGRAGGGGAAGRGHRRAAAALAAAAAGPARGRRGAAAQGAASPPPARRDPDLAGLPRWVGRARRHRPRPRSRRAPQHPPRPGAARSAYRPVSRATRTSRPSHPTSPTPPRSSGPSSTRGAPGSGPPPTPYAACSRRSTRARCCAGVAEVVLSRTTPTASAAW